MTIKDVELYGCKIESSFCRLFDKQQHRNNTQRNKNTPNQMHDIIDSQMRQPQIISEQQQNTQTHT